MRPLGLLSTIVVLFAVVGSVPLKLDHRSQKLVWDEYQVMAFVGQPIQPVDLILDISTSDIWFYSDDCKTCPQSARNRPTVSAKGETFSHTYTTQDNNKEGTVQGEIVTDDLLLIPDIHGLEETKKHKIALITSMTGGDETVDPYGRKRDGRLGLGLDLKSQTSPINMFFGSYEKLLCLIKGSEDGFPLSKLLLGQKMLDSAVEYTKLGDSQVVDGNNGLWTITLNEWSFGKFSSFNKFKAQLSTTTSLINVPNSLYTQFVKLLGAFQQDGELRINCDKRAKAPIFELVFDKLQRKLDPSTYIVKKPDTDVCVVKIGKSTVEDYFVLGTSFLDTLSFCLNYDTKIVTFLDVTGYKNEE